MRAFYERRGYQLERVAVNILRAVRRNRAIAPAAPAAPEAHLMFAFTRVSPPAARWLSARMATFFK